MSKEQNDRHIIWSNINLEVADWRDGYKEYELFLSPPKNWGSRGAPLWWAYV